MRKSFVALTLLAGIGVSSEAKASTISFSNIVVTGSLSTGASWSTGVNAIDFFLPAAAVGDGLPARIGSISLTYIAESKQGMDQDRMLLSVLGALAGSGTIFFNEVVEDFTNPADPVILATHSVVIDDFGELPYTAVLDFLRPSSRIKVKKSLTLTALDTETFDLAAVGLVEQTLRVIPEPASGLLLALAGTVAHRRRSRAPLRVGAGVAAA
jgi:hypothetical protein